MLNSEVVTSSEDLRLKAFADALELFKKSDKYNRRAAVEHLCNVFKQFDFVCFEETQNTAVGKETLQSLIEVISKMMRFCLKPDLINELYGLLYGAIMANSWGIKSLFEIRYLLKDFACQKSLGDFFAHELHDSETYFTLNNGKMREAIGYAINSYHYALQIAKTEPQKNEIYEILNQLEKEVWEYINTLQATYEVEDLQKLWINTEQFLAKIEISNVQRLQTEEDAQNLKEELGNYLNSFALRYPTIDVFCQEVIRSPGNIREQILSKTQGSSLEKIEQLANQEFLPLAKFCSKIFIKRCQQKNWKITQENMSRLLALQNRTYESRDKFAPRWQDYYQKLHDIRNETPKWMKQKTTADDEYVRNNFAEEAEHAETELNRKFISLLHDITANIVKQLGKLPKACDFYLLSLGSLSIGCGAFFSDIESCLALSERYPENEPYFTRFLFALEITIRLLGEDENSLRAGFHLDEGIQPQIFNNLYARADKFIPELPNNPIPAANRLEEDETLTDGIRFSLMTPNVIYAHQVIDKPLLANYFAGRTAFNEQDFDLEKYPLTAAGVNMETATIKYRQACALALLAMRDINHVRKKTEQNHTIIWQPDYKAFAGSNSIDIKTHFTKFLRCFVLDLLWYHNLYWTWEQLTTASQDPIEYLLQKQTIYGAIDLLCKNQILNEAFGKILKNAVAVTSLIRNRQQWYREGQFKPETVLLSKETKEAGYPLSSIEKQTLDEVETTLIRPMYEVLTYWIATKQLYTKLDSMKNFHIAEVYLEIIIEKLSKHQASPENLEKIMTRGVEQLEQRKTNVITYLKMHQQLPEAKQRQNFRTALENTRFAEQVKNWPAPNGERETCTKAEQNWKEQFAKLLISNIEDYPQNLPKITVYNENLKTKKYLHPRVVEQLLKQNAIFKSGRFIKKEQQGRQTKGRHLTIPLVIEIEAQEIKVHLKVFPEMPANECASGILTRLIAGYGAPHVELARFEINGEIYPVLISETIIGPELEAIINNEKLNARLEEQLDAYHYSKRIFASMVVNEEDGKGNNYILHYARDYHNYGILYCVDNDRSFFPAVAREDQTRYAYPVVKDIVFCFKRMEDQIDPEARIEFLSLNILSLLKHWLLDLQIKAEQFQELFSESEIKKFFDQGAEGVTHFVNKLFNRKEIDPHPCIISFPIPEHLIDDLYLKLTKMQNLLRERPAITHLELLEEIEPYLGAYCRKLFQDNKIKTIKERFKKGFGKWYQINPKSELITSSHIREALKIQQGHKTPVTLEELSKPKSYLVKEAMHQLIIVAKEHSKQAEVLHKLQQESPEGLTALKQDITSIETRVSIINCLDFGKLENEEYQQAILSSLGECPRVQQLTLLNCQILDDKLFERIIAYFPSLKILKITGCSLISGGGMRTIGMLPMLKELYADNIQRIRTFRISIPMLELQFVRLNKCPQLTAIQFKAPKLTKIEARSCPELAPKLFKVSTEQKCIVKLDGCDKFNKVQRILKSHFFKENQIPKDFLQRLEILFENEQQTELDLSGIKLSSEAIRLLCFLLKEKKTIPITEIDLSGNRIADAELGVINACLLRNNFLVNPKDELVCGWKKIGDEGAKIIAELLKTTTTIKKISLHRNNIGPKGGRTLAEALKENKTVTEMDLYKNQIMDAELSIINICLLRNKFLANPKDVLDCRRKNLGDEGSEVIAELLRTNATIKKINLWQNNIGPTGERALAEALKENKTVTEIDLYGNQIASEGAEAIAVLLKTNTTVKNINLRQNKIGLKGGQALAEALKENETIIEINLFDNQIADAELMAIKACLLRNKFLVDPKNVLICGWNNFGDEGSEVIAELLKTNTTIKKIDLPKNKIGPKGGRALAEALKKNKIVTEIDLFRNQIADEGAEVIAALLKINTTVKKINLRQNKIGQKGGRALAEALKENKTVTEINLSDNQIADAELKIIKVCLLKNKFLADPKDELVCREENLGDEGTKVIAELLKTNTAIKKIELYYNKIGQEGGRALAEALKENKTVTEIDLSGNHIASEGAEVIAALLMTNTTVKKINLRQNKIGQKGGRALAEALKVNKTIVEIDFSDNQIADAELGVIKACLLRNEFLADPKDELVCGWRKLGDEGAKTIAELLKTNTTIKKIDLPKNKIGPKGGRTLAEVLKENKTVTEIDLYGNQIASEGAEVIAALLMTNTTVKKINLRQNKIGQKGGRALAEALKVNKTIVEIDLSDNQIADKGAKVIAELLKTNTTIKRISLCANNIGPESGQALAETLKKNKTVTEIDIGGNQIADAELRVINACLLRNNFLSDPKNELVYKWKWGKLDWVNLGDEGARVIAELLKTNTPIKKIDLYLNDIGSEGGRALAKALRENKTITEIDLSGNQIADEGGRAFAELLKTNTTIEKINLCGNKIGPEGGRALAEALKKNKAVTGIGLSHNQIANEGVKVIAKLLRTNTAIKMIDLSKNNIRSEGIRVLVGKLKKNKTITEINLGGNQIADKGAKAIAELLKINTTIKKIGLSGNKIGAEGGRALVEALKENKTVIEIYLYDNQIADEEAKAIAELLKTNITIKKINLAENKIGSEGGRALAEALKENEMITEINLDRNQIAYTELGVIKAYLFRNKFLANPKDELNCNGKDFGNEGVEVIVELLKSNTTIKKINLCENNIGQKGGQALAEALKENKMVTEIDLRSNLIMFADEGVSVEGVRAIAELLQGNSTIKKIVLSANDIGSEGGRALAEALKENKTVTEIDLSYNQIADEGAEAIAELLKTNTTIKKISLWGNNIGQKGGRALAEALKENKTVTEIDFFHNQIAYTDLDTINSYIQRNKSLSKKSKSLYSLNKILLLGDCKIGINIIRQFNIKILSQTELKQFLQLSRISRNWCTLFKEPELQAMRTEVAEKLQQLSPP